MKTQILFLFAAGLGTWGCGRVVATPIGAGQASSYLAEPDDGSLDPYACKMQQVDRSSPLYPSLGDGGVIQSFTSVQDGNAVFVGLCKRNQQICWYTREDVSTNETTGQMDFGFDMVCQYTCDVDADCPAASEGTAVATCVNANPALPKSGQCALVCAGGLTCPTGFACAQPLVATVGPDYQQTPSPRQCLQTKRLSSNPALTPPDAGAVD